MVVWSRLAGKHTTLAWCVPVLCRDTDLTCKWKIHISDIIMKGEEWDWAHFKIHTRLLGSWPLVSGRWGVADWNYRQMWTHILKSDCHTLPQPGCPQANRSSFIEDDGSPLLVAASHYFLRVGQWRQASLPRTFGNFGQSSIEVLLHTIRCLWICNPWALCLRWGYKFILLVIEPSWFWSPLYPSTCYLPSWFRFTLRDCFRLQNSVKG